MASGVFPVPQKTYEDFKITAMGELNVKVKLENNTPSSNRVRVFVLRKRVRF